MSVLENCKQPSWVMIVKLCKEKIEEKYPQYGNSWVGYMSKAFWKKRLKGEVAELNDLLSFEHDKRIKELVDIINICAMQITNHLDQKEKEYWIQVVNQRLGVG